MNNMKYYVFTFLFFAFMTVSSISAQEITMFPGFWTTKYYEDDKQISKQQVETLMRKDSEANQYWLKSQQHMTIGWVAFGAEVGFLVWQLNRASNGESQTAPLMGLLGSAGVAIGFGISANSLKKKAILRYNQSTGVSSFKFGTTKNGLGLVLQF
jgi:hypothetical protein